MVIQPFNLCYLGWWLLESCKAWHLWVFVLLRWVCVFSPRIWATSPDAGSHGHILTIQVMPVLVSSFLFWRNCVNLIEPLLKLSIQVKLCCTLPKQIGIPARLSSDVGEHHGVYCIFPGVYYPIVYKTSWKQAPAKKMTIIAVIKSLWVWKLRDGQMAPGMNHITASFSQDKLDNKQYSSWNGHSNPPQRPYYFKANYLFVGGRPVFTCLSRGETKPTALIFPLPSYRSSSSSVGLHKAYHQLFYQSLHQSPWILKL